MKTNYLLVLILITIVSCGKNNKENGLPPEINSFSPASGHYKSLLTIRGNHFSSKPSEVTVQINGKDAPVQSSSESVITALVPERVGSGIVTVTTTNGISRADSFFYVPNIFIAGSEMNNNRYVAKYWKNDIATVIQDSSIVNSLFIDGDDVYVAGYTTHTPAGNNEATYWKNGTPFILNTNDLIHGSILSICIFNNTIYASGSAIDYSTSKNIGVYWKNNVMTKLDDGTGNCAMNSISADANNIYVVGGTWGSNTKAKFWQNNNPWSLPLNAGESSTAFSVFATGNSTNDIYVAGYETAGANSTAVYWKNGNKFSLTNGITNAWANEVIVSDNDVYVTGFENDGVKDAAVYWKNGDKVVLGTGSNPTYGNSIKVLGNDVYVAGYEKIGSKNAAVYWKNGTKTYLTDGSNDGYAASVFLQ